MCRYGLLGLVRLVCSDSFSGSIKTRIKTRINRAKSLKLRCGVRRRSHRRSHCVVPRADVFNLIFVVDMLAKLYGLGCIGYWGDGWNALVSMTVVDCGRKGSRDALRTPPRLQPVLLAYHSDVSDAAGAAPHAHVWKGLYIVVMTLGKALSLMSNRFLLMLMVMLIFALMDMQLLLVVSSTASRSSHGCTSTHSCPPCLLSSSS